MTFFGFCKNDPASALPILDFATKKVRSHQQLRHPTTEIVMLLIVERCAMHLKKICMSFHSRLTQIAIVGKLRAADRATLAHLLLEIGEIKLYAERLRDVVNRLDKEFADPAATPEGCSGMLALDRRRRAQETTMAHTSAGSWGYLMLHAIKDRLEKSTGTLTLAEELGKRIHEEDVEAGEELMNTSLFVISLLSAMFFPAEFLTGVFGMSLNDMTTTVFAVDNGFYQFWILTGATMICFSSSTLLIIRYSRDGYYLSTYWATVAMGIVFSLVLGYYCLAGEAYLASNPNATHIGLGKLLFGNPFNMSF